MVDKKIGFRRFFYSMAIKFAQKCGIGSEVLENRLNEIREEEEGPIVVQERVMDAEGALMDDEGMMGNENGYGGEDLLAEDGDGGFANVVISMV